MVLLVVWMKFIKIRVEYCCWVLHASLVSLLSLGSGPAMPFPASLSDRGHSVLEFISPFPRFLVHRKPLPSPTHSLGSSRSLQWPVLRRAASDTLFRGGLFLGHAGRLTIWRCRREDGKRLGCSWRRTSVCAGRWRWIGFGWFCRGSCFEAYWCLRVGSSNSFMK